MSDLSPPSTPRPKRRTSMATGLEFPDARVMVVDDNLSNVTLLQRLLRTAGVDGVEGFTDPAEALARCSSALPDLILLDLHMPRIDGFAVMASLDEMVPEDGFLPVLVLTADASTQTKQRALASGAKDFLAKPFDSIEVVLRVRNLLETTALYARLHRSRAELQAELDERRAREQAAAAEFWERSSRIDAVLRENAMSIVFQPIVDLRSGSVMGTEALARFEGEPQRPPNQWFAEAATVGRGEEMELAAVRAALGQLDSLPAGTFMSVNVSPTTACADGLVELLEAQPGERLVLEITEHDAVTDYESLLEALEVPRAYGVRIALDDTGAGYAGLQHLLRLKPHVVKLDLALTRTIDVDPVRRALASALVSFAEEIGAIVIAEGIESPGELDTLRGLRVPWGQGYHLGRPGPLPEAVSRV